MISAAAMMEAFAYAGLTQTATCNGTSFEVDLRTSDELILAGMAQSATTVIEYATSAVTLQRGSTVNVAGRDWRVKEVRRLESGEYSWAVLE